MLAPIYTLSSSKAPKRSKFSATNLREKPVDFLWHRTDVDFGSRNNFTNLGSFEKLSVAVETIIPWCSQRIINMNRDGNFCEGT